MPFTSVKTKRWNREQYYRMAEMGWFDDRRVELIDGEIIEMSPQKRRHSISILKARKLLERAFGAGFTVQDQLPLALADTDEPEPDIAVVPGEPNDFPDDHPTSALLVLEISESTLDFDLDEKAALYARYGIQDYWVLNLINHTLIVHRQPTSDTSTVAHGYAEVTQYPANASVAPLAAPHASILVADLLP